MSELSFNNPTGQKKVGALLTVATLVAILGVVTYAIRSGRLLRPRASNTSVDIGFEPLRKSVFVGDSFEVQILLSTAIAPLPSYAAASFTLQFDPNLLSVVEVKRAEASIPRFSSIEIATLPNTVNQSGLLPLLALSPQTSPTGPSVVLGIVTLRAKTPGQAQLSVRVDPTNPRTYPSVVKNATESAQLAVNTIFPVGQYTIGVPPTPTPSATPTLPPPPPLGASGGPSISDQPAPTPAQSSLCCNPTFAFDGNFETYWAGNPGANLAGGQWNLYYNYGETKPSGSTIAIMYHAISSTSGYYPGSAKLFIGKAGTSVVWTQVGNLEKQPVNTFTAPHEFQYLWLALYPGTNTPPYIREITVIPLGASGGPTLPTTGNVNCCSPGFAFDTNPDTFWAGDTSANVPNGEWKLFYNLGPNDIKPAGKTVTLSFFTNPTTPITGYFPGSFTLDSSIDGGLWKAVTSVNQPNQPTYTMTVQDSFQFLRFTFKPGTNTPPYVKTIAILNAPPPTPTSTPTPTQTPTPTILPQPTATPSPTQIALPTVTPTRSPTPTLPPQFQAECETCVQTNSVYCVQAPGTSSWCIDQAEADQYYANDPTVYCRSQCGN